MIRKAVSRNSNVRMPHLDIMTRDGGLALTGH